MAGSVALAVGAPVIVAALVTWNNIVKVIDAIRRTRRHRREVRARLRVLNHRHGIVPAHERGHLHGRDHIHGHAHGVTPQV